MSYNQKANELANKLYYNIANKLRGNMDASKFKDYMLGFIFYRYLSEKFVNEVIPQLKDIGYDYYNEENEDYKNMEKHSYYICGFFIKKEHLFQSIVEDIACNKFNITILQEAFSSFSEIKFLNGAKPYEGIFDGINLASNELGQDDKKRTKLISQILLEIARIDFEGDYHDLLGTAYMILVSKFASDAGKKAGEFFTPVGPCKVLARLATVGVNHIDNIADPCAGSGSLMLLDEIKKLTDNHTVYYAQELNASTYNLMRMNFLLNGISHDQIHATNDNTLEHDFLKKDVQIQISNPPYSAEYELNNTIKSDPRFEKAGAYPSKKYSDLLFVEHIIYHMREDGRAAVLVPHGVLFRGGQEKKIRKHILSLGYLDAIVSLPENLFLHTGIPVACLVFDRQKKDDNIFFINASKEFVKMKNQNELTDENIDKIVDAYTKKEDIERFCRMVSMDEIKANDYKLNIPQYVDNTEPEPKIDLDEVCQKIQKGYEEIRNISADLKKDFDALHLTFPFYPFL